MKSLKRLFLFAGFDSDNMVDDTLLYYLGALSKLGDIVFVMDSDLPKSEIKKLAQIPNMLYINIGRHGEYDFGSYKRGYLWVYKNLKRYDWVYLVNDSVYGPLGDLSPVLNNLEHSGADLTGMVANHDPYTPLHIQSWFLGLNKKAFTSKIFDTFMRNIKLIKHRTSLIMQYEVGLSCKLIRNGFKPYFITDSNVTDLYEEPLAVLKSGVPFIKKKAVSKIRRMYFLYPYVENRFLTDAIDADMKRHKIKMVKNNLRLVFSLRFFGIPLINIKAKDQEVYKIYLFGFIPILKIQCKI